MRELSKLRESTAEEVEFVVDCSKKDDFLFFGNSPSLFGVEADPEEERMHQVRGELLVAEEAADWESLDESKRIVDLDRSAVETEREGLVELDEEHAVLEVEGEEVTES